MSSMAFLLIVFLLPIASPLELNAGDICGFILLPSGGDDQDMYIVHEDWNYNEAYISTKSDTIYTKERTHPLAELWPNLFKEPWPAGSCIELASFASGESDRVNLATKSSNQMHVFGTINLNNAEVGLVEEHSSSRHFYQVSTSTANDLALLYSHGNAAAFDLYKVSMMQGGKIQFTQKQLNTLWMNEKTKQASFKENQDSDWARNSLKFGAGFVFNGKYYLLLSPKSEFFIFNYPTLSDVWSYNTANVFAISQSSNLVLFVIIGIVVGGVFVVGLLFFFLCRKIKANKKNSSAAIGSRSSRPGKGLRDIESAGSPLNYANSVGIVLESKATDVGEGGQENVDAAAEEEEEAAQEEEVTQPMAYGDTSGVTSEHEPSEVMLAKAKKVKKKKNKKNKASLTSANKKTSSGNLARVNTSNTKKRSLGTINSKGKKTKSVGATIKSKGLKNTSKRKKKK